MSQKAILDKLISLKTEWDECDKRIAQIKEELKPIIIGRLKQLNYKEEEGFFAKIKIGPRIYERKKSIRGLISWNEDFIDEGTGAITTIERHKVVMVDGEWYISALSLEELINFKHP